MERPHAPVRQPMTRPTIDDAPLARLLTYTRVGAGLPLGRIRLSEAIRWAAADPAL